MIKLVIVDDEYMIREGLRSMIPWQDFGIEVVGVAANGAAGLELVQQVQADILLTDIRMPGFDGLELIVRAKQQLPKLICILLTGHGEFSYAQQALKIGAFDFLLKPTDEEELIGIMRRAVVRIREAEQKQQEYAQLFCQRYMKEPSEAHYEEMLPYFQGKEPYAVVQWGEGVSADVLLVTDVRNEGEIAGPVEIHLRQLGMNANRMEIGVSEIIADLRELPIAYQQARLAMEQQLAAGERGILYFSQMNHQVEIIKAVDFVDQHYTTNITLSELASRCFMSDSYFSRLFKQVTGKNFTDYVTEKRMRKAKELLHGTSLKTYEIAQRVGYSDQRYFSQVFRRMVGVTPSDFRNQEKF